jgi:hypothetical protein
MKLSAASVEMTIVGRRGEKTTADPYGMTNKSTGNDKGRNKERATAKAEADPPPSAKDDKQKTTAS